VWTPCLTIIGRAAAIWPIRIEAGGDLVDAEHHRLDGAAEQVRVALGFLEVTDAGIVIGALGT
jgi:hypothetical protein